MSRRKQLGLQRPNIRPPPFSDERSAQLKADDRSRDDSSQLNFGRISHGRLGITWSVGQDKKPLCLLSF